MPLGPLKSWQDEPCARWRVKDADGDFGPWNHRTTQPLLPVGNIFDPATPYQNPVAMLNTLARAQMLTLSGYGHTRPGLPTISAGEQVLPV